MTYLSGKAQKRRRYTLYTLYVSIFLIVLIFWLPIKKVSYTILEPVLLRYGVTKESFVVFPEFFDTYVSSHQTLAQKNKELRLEVERLSNLLAENDAKLREASVIEALDIKSDTKPIIVYPVMSDITRLYSTIIFSKGYKDGLTAGSIVYLKGNRAVCTLKEVSNSSSVCQLLTSSGVTTEGVTSSSSINLPLVGRGGYYTADVIRDTPVTVGELVYLKSNPKVILGSVREIAHNNQDTSWHIFVDGSYNPITSSIFYVQP